MKFKSTTAVSYKWSQSSTTANPMWSQSSTAASNKKVQIGFLTDFFRVRLALFFRYLNLSGKFRVPISFNKIFIVRTAEVMTLLHDIIIS